MAENKTVRGSQATAHRRGQALVEFAIISFVLSAIVAGLLGIMVLALGSFQNNIAAEGAGRILDQHEALTEANFLTHFELNPQEFSIEDATAQQVYQFLNEFGVDSYERPEVDEAGEQTYETVDLPLYDETLLILSIDSWLHLGAPENANKVPAINRLLLPSYIFDPDITSVDGEAEDGAYRYPGAVVTNGDGKPSVLIPLLDDDRDGTTVPGIERTFNIDPDELDDEELEGDYAYPVASNWVAPVTVVKCEECGDVDNGVAFKLVIFYPSQPASMISLEVVRDAEGRIESQTPVEADDEALETQQSGLATLPTGYEPLTEASDVTLEENSAFGASASRGKYGLGESYAFLMKVRPYRRVFETASVFRLQHDRLIAKYEYIDEVEDPLNVGETVAVSRQLQDDIPEALMFLNPLIERDFDSLADDSLASRLRLVRPNSSMVGNENIQLTVPQSGKGAWRVVVAAEIEPRELGQSWLEGHVLEIRVYRNDTFVQLIAAQTLVPPIAEPIPQSGDQTGDETGDGTEDETEDKIQLVGQAVIDAEPKDVIQVRIYSKRPDDATYDVQLTGAPERNWVTYEFLGAR
ncbi:hypothetical protein FF011L_04690 [Roseimaritima multifibrata]|uniref:Uncharacterized protein n=1 Tax=Roseimaritima multifibrata TaxID=1930274 RepID=A0A517MA25_9BACT|nr:hypothetical protein [Roseimaritima multifibrata]QDS91736.1 hypothetical protein FF011L_04690 [Roseimaritima multifibrata]